MSGRSGKRRSCEASCKTGGIDLLIFSKDRKKPKLIIQLAGVKSKFGAVPDEKLTDHSQPGLRVVCEPRLRDLSEPRLREVSELFSEDRRFCHFTYRFPPKVTTFESKRVVFKRKSASWGNSAKPPGEEAGSCHSILSQASFFPVRSSLIL